MDSTLREFKLFHSIMVKVKKEFLKTLFLLEGRCYVHFKSSITSVLQESS